jgi:hypothetical protein
MCAHLLGVMPCINDQPHEGNGRGCVHESATGSWVPDHHDEGNHS